jgi:hypothetical protein
VTGRPPAQDDGSRPPSFDEEIRAAIRYERGIAVKALVAIALVLAVLAIRVWLPG